MWFCPKSSALQISSILPSQNPSVWCRFDNLNVMAVQGYPFEVEGNKIRHHSLLRSVFCCLRLLGRVWLLYGQHRDESEQPSSSTYMIPLFSKLRLYWAEAWEGRDSVLGRLRRLLPDKAYMRCSRTTRFPSPKISPPILEMLVWVELCYLGSWGRVPVGLRLCCLNINTKCAYFEKERFSLPIRPSSSAA